MTPVAPSPVPGINPVQAIRPAGAIAGIGAGQSFSDDPFARMLEQSRQAARLQARREQERDTPKTPAREAEATAAPSGPQTASPDAEAGRPTAANPAATAQDTRADGDKTAKSQAETARGDGSAANAGSNTSTNNSKHNRLPPIATQPGESSPTDPTDPGPDPTAPGASGVRRRPHEPPVECPVEPWHVHALHGKGAGQSQRAALAESAAAAAAQGQGQPNQDAPPAVAGLAAAATAAAAAADAAELAAASASAAAPASATGQAAQSNNTAATLPPAPSTPTQAHLPAHPNSSSFGLQLSHQVTLWLRQGVTEARLNLNPADLGPVQVAITLDGQAAQVRLSADQALTRQALEQALPGLASSLAEAGFLLAGGGVFDQPQGQTSHHTPEHNAADQAGHRASPTASDDSTTAAPNQSLPRASRGQVDLIA